MQKLQNETLAGCNYQVYINDEGFGSLDSETLEQATSVLTKLQDIGRTVGLITHVELMVDQLPIGIRISKTNNGSTLELVD